LTDFGEKALLTVAFAPVRTVRRRAARSYFGKFLPLQLQVAIDEVVLLQPAEPLADIAGAHCAHS
jgi:hypothetical protein